MSVWQDLLKPVMFVLLMVRIAVCRVSIVRTVHNASPHEPLKAFESALLRWLDRRTGTWIVLSEQTRTPPHGDRVVIPHGHYRDWYGDVVDREPAPGSLLYFGLIREYKGVDRLIRAAHGLDETFALRILGAPQTAAIASDLRAAAKGDARIELDLEFATDRDLAEAISDAEAVILPYENMHNSGALLLALSLNRQVIVPRTPTTQELVDEFGDDWVITYDGPLTTGKLRSVLSVVRSTSPGRPLDMSRRDWARLGLQLAGVYRTRAPKAPQNI
ncbi:glycosyltransferase [Cellulomonas dongxiuzhuiae]|uniref:glycosyltransferase n=1 Tax=Cellulomonas dongxiuzhuiae TaxID=2819979 RepID=UPI001AAE9F34|nr:glycosyltransferase [Cellulomonas dongxiuzhuiae]MBO3088799.1 hypothetical protein [Cellulomonas dongxiuzhuiae]